MIETTRPENVLDQRQAVVDACKAVKVLLLPVHSLGFMPLPCYPNLHACLILPHQAEEELDEVLLFVVDVMNVRQPTSARPARSGRGYRGPSKMS